MKRFPRTLTAAVMAGALAVGGATVAQAQENQPVPGAAATPPARGAAANPEDVKSQEDNEKPAEGDGTGTPAEEGPNENEDPASDENQGIPDPVSVTVDGVEYFKTTNDKGEIVYRANDPYGAADTTELTRDEALAIRDKQLAEDQNPGDNQGSSDFDKKKLAWLALPAALIIGGIVYHLMKDGQTYTPDEGRKNEDPTAEEKAASDKMLAENKDEVIAQGGQLAEGADAAATDRGIAAETGSNAAARGLAALAVVAMVAAGAFAASRKLFA
ncbi:hypothetical protein [Corynebacterium sp. HMSC27B11]|uniref:hypothetical protein n=1 Tax=Corynebacterium sp. HMSC27B11 TaxID=1581065 RepID=UPI0008A63C45|nr:hypothetical protein [Corynebacterium sp. HMSC27B11]OFS17751.1 hypothetical protein HMPREF3097_03770 [Corynebacterium sp. HMSC27B11]